MEHFQKSCGKTWTLLSIHLHSTVGYVISYNQVNVIERACSGTDPLLTVCNATAPTTDRPCSLSAPPSALANVHLSSITTEERFGAAHDLSLSINISSGKNAFHVCLL